jgi:hypothetical protein
MLFVLQLALAQFMQAGGEANAVYRLFRRSGRGVTRLCALPFAKCPPRQQIADRAVVPSAVRTRRLFRPKACGGRPHLMQGRAAAAGKQGR